jgi:hypothetical protein
MKSKKIREKRLTWHEADFKGGFLGFFSFYVQYSKLLHLPPLRFHCAGGCWDRTRTVANTALAVRHSYHSARSHLLDDAADLPLWLLGITIMYILRRTILKVKMDNT